MKAETSTLPPPYDTRNAYKIKCFRCWRSSAEGTGDHVVELSFTLIGDDGDSAAGIVGIGCSINLCTYKAIIEPKIKVFHGSRAFW